MSTAARILAFLLAFSLSGAPVAVMAAVSRVGSGPTGLSLLDGLATIMPTGLLRFVEGSQQLSTGNDGRLTLLLLGSDTRAGGVARTDTVIVMSLRGNSISALSIPRDTARIPNPDGGTFSARINAILKALRDGRTPAQALAKFEEVIEHLLQIEIDYHALVKFPGFQQLVDEIDPVTMDITRPIADSRFWDDPNQPSGVYFPAATNYDLYAWQPGANPLCNGLWRFQATPIPSSYWCRRAMPFVRSRKSSSDFVRARRQQDFVIASISRVINRGSGDALGSLVGRAQDLAAVDGIETNIPITGATALDFYQRLSGARVDLQVVLAPHKYAKHIPGGTAYELDLVAVRQLTRQWFGGSDNPSVPPATTIPTAPPPGATTQPTFGPTADPPPGPTGGPSFGPGSTLPPSVAPSTPSSGLGTPAPTVQPGAPTASAPAGSQPSPPAVAAASPSGEPVAGVPQPSPPSALVPPSALQGSGGLLMWLAALAVAVMGAAAVSLFWLRTRRAR